MTGWFRGSGSMAARTRNHDFGVTIFTRGGSPAMGKVGARRRLARSRRARCSAAATKDVGGLAVGVVGRLGVARNADSVLADGVA
jgi:hypothetical protein